MAHVSRVEDIVWAVGKMPGKSKNMLYFEVSGRVPKAFYDLGRGVNPCGIISQREAADLVKKLTLFLVTSRLAGITVK